MTEQLEIEVEVEAVDSTEKAVRGADIVALTTDSLIPVIRSDWLEPGMHVTNSRANEAGPDVLERLDVLARLGDSTMLLDHAPADSISGSDGMFGYFVGTEEERKRVPSASLREFDDPRIGTLPDLMAGRWKGQTDDKQITFLHNAGTQGLQFAAVGAKAYELAKAKGLGHALPLEWFVQNIRD